MTYALIDTVTGRQCGSATSPPNSMEGIEILAQLFKITTGHDIEVKEIKE